MSFDTEDTPLSLLLKNGTLRRPDGTGSVHLFRALASLCGYNAFHDDEDVELLRRAIGEYPHYIFILVDGMGESLRRFFPAGGFLASADTTILSGVYPSTTAVALTSQATGLWPAEHGVTGWHTYLPDRNLTVLPLKASERFSRKSLKHFHIPFSEVIAPDSIVPRYTYSKRVFLKKSLRGGYFGKWAFFGITRTGASTFVHSFDRLIHHVHGAEGTWFSHLYIEDLDSVSHRRGPDSEAVGSLLEKIDAQLSRLRDAAGEQVRIIVTADHGHIGVDPERHHLLHEYDPILDLLLAPPSGESRNPIFHVRDGMEDLFADLFTKRYGDDFVLVTPQVVETEKLMGPVSLSDVTRARMGTFIGIAKTDAAIEYIPADGQSKNHVGMHGGLSSQEIEVPLIVM